MMQDLRAAAVQFNHAPGDKDANRATVRAFTEQAAAQNVDLLSFPEMCITGYWHLRTADRTTLDSLAEPIPDGPSTQMLLTLADTHDMVVAAGFIEKDEDALYNAFVVAQPNGEIAVHRKLHCFLNEHMSSGDTYTVFDAPGLGRLGVLTCWDNNLVENARITALKGAELLLAPHQTGGCDSRSPDAMGLIDPKLWHNRHENPEAIEAEFRGPKGREWLMRWLPARAHDNGMFLVFSNGVGLDDNEVRTGNAMLLDPYGRIVEETWKAEDKMVVADLDAGLLDMCTGQRWLRGRRPELYAPIATRTGEELDPRAARFQEE
ncbi:nitrilase family protein [Salinibacter sp. 10B]|uniref:nitrilase family protein n=1 Tax=Salinibacter sp. 10B TaxID=1923971 RepID=UPI0023431C6D